MSGLTCYLTLHLSQIPRHFPKLKPEFAEEYKRLHANVWPGVLAALGKHHISDYSISHYPPLQLLIATFKYTGDDYEKDMKAIGEDEETRKWWEITDRMQESFNDGATGSGKEIPWWTVSKCVPSGHSFCYKPRRTGRRRSVPV